VGAPGLCFRAGSPVTALEDGHVVEQVGMDLMSMSRSKRFIAGCSIARRTVVALLLFGKLWLGELGSMPKSAAFFLWLFVVILSCASASWTRPTTLPSSVVNLSHPGVDTLYRHHRGGADVPEQSTGLIITGITRTFPDRCWMAKRCTVRQQSPLLELGSVSQTLRGSSLRIESAFRNTSSLI
jgi:hypothetical protein